MADIMKKEEVWVAVDLDGTLVEYNGERDMSHIGREVPTVVGLIRSWLLRGIKIAIFTSRVSESRSSLDRSLAYIAIGNWLTMTFGEEHTIIITADKDPRFALFLDDRAVACLTNLGLFTIPPGPLAPPRQVPTVPELLREGAELYEARNSDYGDNYKQFGRIMAGMFPRGLSVESGDVDGWNRLGLVFMAVSKLSRYTQNPNGYHKDSARDLKVYGAMLEELTPDGTKTS